ncbi:MAG: hypothetical protein OXG44_12640 [Gammaproteobacteria bacterium]|nr:hypothetical protein [Gammaproteobacteria bacterium]
MTTHPLPANWQHRSTTSLTRILMDHTQRHKRLIPAESRRLRGEIARRYKGIAR